VFKELFPKGHKTDPPELSIDKFRKQIKDIGIMQNFNPQQIRDLEQSLVKKGKSDGKNEKFVDLKIVKEKMDKGGKSSKPVDLSATIAVKNMSRWPIEAKKTIEELETYLKKNNWTAEKLFRAMDKDKNNQVDKSEFVAFFNT
jgi:hypothetical protein